MSPRLIRARKASSVRETRELARLLEGCKNEWLKNKVREMEALLKEDMTLGEKISKDKWPSYYVLKWGLRNLYKINIGPDWRMPYTLEFEGAGIAVVCLDLLPHKKYDRLFGYRTT